MAEILLNRHHVAPGLVHATSVRSAAVMRREGRDARALREIMQPVVHRLLGEPSGPHAPVTVTQYSPSSSSVTDAIE